MNKHQLVSGTARIEARRNPTCSFGTMLDSVR
jgi:hypothetical protein